MFASLRRHGPPAPEPPGGLHLLAALCAVAGIAIHLLIRFGYHETGPPADVPLLVVLFVAGGPLVLDLLWRGARGKIPAAAGECLRARVRRHHRRADSHQQTPATSGAAERRRRPAVTYRRRDCAGGHRSPGRAERPSHGARALVADGLRAGSAAFPASRLTVAGNSQRDTVSDRSRRRSVTVR